MNRPKNFIDVDDESYETVLEDEHLVLLYYWAEWCGPCRSLNRTLAELARAHPSLTIARVDTDQNEAALDEFGIESVPMIILLVDGEPVDFFAGKVPYPKLERGITDHLNERDRTDERH